MTRFKGISATLPTQLRLGSMDARATVSLGPVFRRVPEVQPSFQVLGSMSCETEKYPQSTSQPPPNQPLPARQQIQDRPRAKELELAVSPISCSSTQSEAALVFILCEREMTRRVLPQVVSPVGRYACMSCSKAKPLPCVVKQFD